VLPSAPTRPLQTFGRARPVLGPSQHLGTSHQCPKVGRPHCDVLEDPLRATGANALHGRHPVLESRDILAAARG
jgi:hypothetical protein